MAQFIRKAGLSSLVLAAALGACSDGAKTQVEQPAAQAEQPVTLQSIIDDPRRSDERARDKYRHPKATLEFFGLEPGQSVAEVWPGWYTNITAPYLAETGGTYTAILYDPASGERAQKRIAAYQEAYSDQSVYGDIAYGALGKNTTSVMAPQSADMLLSFRNVHNWMSGGYAEKAFEEFYAALKPGGILGIVEHRLPESAQQDPTGSTGYVQESYIKTLASDAGFEFVASSEINANPKDMTDHPYGVWTLPPRSKTPEAGSPEAEGFDAQTYKDIGESDRATLKFRKPL